MEGIQRKILVSVDDGKKMDLELGNLFLKYKIPAVFYIPVETTDLSPDDIKRIAKGDYCPKRRNCPALFEIGAHTLTHPQDLKLLDDISLTREISESKKKLEEIIKKPVYRFCYPRGRFDERVKQKVKEAGFSQARTTRVLSTEFPADPFETDTSIHVYPDRKEYGGKSWVEVGYELFEKVIKEGGRFEMWMHSKEVEQYNMWEFLEDFVAYMDDEMKKIRYPRKI